MEHKFNNNMQHRKFVRAVKPSERSPIKYKPRPTLPTGEITAIKRKNNEESKNNSKRIKNDINAVETAKSPPKCPCPSSKPTKNLANQRLQKLKKNLLQNQKESVSYSKPLDYRDLQNNDKNNVQTLPQRPGKSVQDRLVIKREPKLNKTFDTCAVPGPKIRPSRNLNQSLPSCSSTATQREHYTPKSALNKRLAPQKHQDVAFSPNTNSTPVKSEYLPQSHDVGVQATPAATTNVNWSFVESTDMDWSPITEDVVIQNISEVRKEFDYRQHTFSALLDAAGPPIAGDAHLSAGLHIVVDTNIFLSHLNFVSELMKKTFKGQGRTIILVPWMVIQELDFMKDGRSNKSLKHNAKRAVDLINSCLKNKDPHLAGQSVIDASKQNIQSNNPDDGILFCCLQLSQQGKRVVLLSNDKNLRNKAMFSNVLAYGKDEIVAGLGTGEARTGGDRYEGAYVVDKVRLVVGSCLSKIVEAEMSAAYGDVWCQMARVVPPLTLDEAVGCLQRYWTAVFSFRLLKQCKQCVDEFAQYLRSPAYRNAVSREALTSFIEYCLRLCIYLKNGFNEHSAVIYETIGLVQECATMAT